jgi:hypothetical protein
MAGQDGPDEGCRRSRAAPSVPVTYFRRDNGATRMSNTTPPGWFPDPQVQGQQRYWNGNAWTEHTAPFQQPGQTFPSASPAGTNAASAGSADAGGRRNWFLRHPIVSGVAALVLILTAIGAAGGGGDSDERNKTSVASDTETNKATSTTSASPVAEATPAPEPVDTDGDGVSDADDFGPSDPQIRTAMDVDTDGDGVPDPNDDFPEDAKFSTDTDGDGVADRLDAFPKDPKYHSDSDGDGVADSEDAFPTDPSRAEITLAMENALDSAQSYLDISGFSRLGLIDQLSSKYGEGFRVEDATWAVDQLGADWKEQAVRSAKSYLSISPFSHQGLIEQLSSPYGDQFTVEEATYAVDKIGL